MVYWGIDPGLTGALVCLSAEGRLLECLDMPVSVPFGMKMREVEPATLMQMAAAKRVEHGRGVVCVEQVGSRPRQAGQFGFGVSFGIALTAAWDLAVREDQSVVRVWPQNWKRWMGVDGGGKEMPRIWAMQITGREDLFGRVKDSGRGDAWCLAEWVRRSREGLEMPWEVGRESGL